ncbi:MAG: helix-turn-helix domain-containing protein [Actinobacteria bacterium]|nr:helix-turn-helix domain-containing protein [Actinomycetota bacterium]
MQRLLTTDELAALLQIPKATIYRWRYCGEGPRGVRVGRHLRFEFADVQDWLNARKSGGEGLMAPMCSREPRLGGDGQSQLRGVRGRSAAITHARSGELGR